MSRVSRFIGKQFPRTIQWVAGLLLVVPIWMVADQTGVADATIDQLTPAKSDCLFQPMARGNERLMWRDISERAELLAPSKVIENAQVTARRRAVQPPAPGAPNAIPLRNFVDVEVFGKMTRDGVKPTVLSSDEEFLRRVTLDLTGEIPTVETVRSFTADTRTDKRDRMIDQLLASEAFVDRWTMWFGDLVQNVQVSTNSREYYQGRNAYYSWIRDSIRSGKAYDQMVRELLAGKGDNFVIGTANYWVRQIQPNGPIQDTYDNLSAHSAEKFLALPMTCVSCHSGARHLEMINSYMAGKTRAEFWSNAAFFAKNAATVIRDPALPNVRKYDIVDNPLGSYRLNTTSGNKTPRAPSTGQPNTSSPSFFLTGETPRAGEPLRDAYGRMLTAHPQFARASVNYLWKELFTLGIIEPVDSIDLLRLSAATLPGGSTLQPTHPALLESLADSFRSSNYSLRAILKTMTTSSAYQLSSRYTPGTWSEAWTPYFARHYVRRLSAEALLDAIFRATNVSAQLPVQGLPAVQKAMLLPDPLELGGRAGFGAFLNNFGRGDRDDSPRSNDGSILQALSLMNDPLITTRVRNTQAGSSVQTILRTTTVPGDIVDSLCLATLSRRPTAVERQAGIMYLTGGNLTTKTEDLQFVFLNKLEFLFN